MVQELEQVDDGLQLFAELEYRIDEGRRRAFFCVEFSLDHHQPLERPEIDHHADVVELREPVLGDVGGGGVEAEVEEPIGRFVAGLVLLGVLNVEF